MVKGAVARSAQPTLLAQILIERYGLDGKRPRSLAEVATRHGLMRQTVRYFEGQLLEYLKPVLVKELAKETRS